MLRSRSHFSFSCYIKPFVIYSDYATLKKVAMNFIDADIRFYFYSDEYIITTDDPTEFIEKAGFKCTICQETWVQGTSDRFLGFEMKEKSTHFDYLHIVGEGDFIRLQANNIYIKDESN